jgi:dUTP pyrophosphatase
VNLKRSQKNKNRPRSSDFQMESIKVHLRQKEGFEDLPLPCYMTDGSSGMDVYAAIDGQIILRPGEIRLIPGGIFLSIPPGYEAQVRPRSGLALKHGIGILNSPGTIDSDYRGEVGIILFNYGQDPFIVNRGESIAQLVFSRVVRADLIAKENLDTTKRGSGGFGHTDDKRR